MPRPAPLLAAALFLLFSPARGSAGETSRPHATRHLVIQLARLRALDASPAEVLVSGGVSTILTTPWELRRRGTGVAGRGERPFEVLLGARRVVLTPTRPLVAGEKFPFVVRLVDDTVIPVVLVAAPAGRADGEVAVSFEDDDKAELRVQLAAMTDQLQGLQAQLQQALREQDSADFALAQLFAGGQAPLTAMDEIHSRDLVNDERSRIRLTTYAQSKRHDARKVAIVLTVINTSQQPMAIGFRDLYNRTTLARLPAAVRLQRTEIAPGAIGRLSIVLDGSSIGADGEALALELLVRRGDVRTDLPVDLSAADFEASWW